MLRHHFDVVRLAVCVDAVNGAAQLARHPEAVKQVLAADELVITKVDLVEPAASLELGEQLMDFNPGAAVFTSRHGLRDVNVMQGHAGEIAASGFDMRGLRRPQCQSVLVLAREPIDWLGFAVWLRSYCRRGASRCFV